jgi:hypothetical protein
MVQSLRCSSWTSDKPITHSDHGLDAFAAVVQLLPQPSDVYVQCPSIAVVAITPHIIQKLLACDHTIRTLGEDREQAKFLISELNLAAVTDYANVREVNQQMIVLVCLGAPVRGSSQDRSNPRH